MKLECTVSEFKELIRQKKTPVAVTTDVTIKIDGEEIAKQIVPYISKEFAKMF